MIAELLASMSAFFYASNGVLVKIGLTRDKNSNVVSATAISMLVDLVFMWSVYLLTSPSFMVETLLVFGLAGIIAQCFGRTLNYTGIQRVGVSVNTPIIGASSLFTALTAVVLLNEIVAPIAYAGIILVILGITLVSQQGAKQDRIGKWRKRSLCFPLAAAVCYGLSSTVRKIGLNIGGSPIGGATISVSVAFPVYISSLILFGKIKTISLNKQSSWFFLGAGICTGLAWICNFNALSLGKVTVVSPILGINPLIAVFLSHLFLKNAEKITYKIVSGVLLVVLGIIVISIFK